MGRRVACSRDLPRDGTGKGACRTFCSDATSCPVSNLVFCGFELVSKCDASESGEGAHGVGEAEGLGLVMVVMVVVVGSKVSTGELRDGMRWDGTGRDGRLEMLGRGEGGKLRGNRVGKRREMERRRKRKREMDVMYVFLW